MSFETAYEAVILREGGYTLHQVAGDRGGQTYAGIARRAHPDWIGWDDIDQDRTPAAEIVRNLYRRRYWDAIQGDTLPAPIAALLFDAAVNMGVKVAIKVAQIVAGVTPDGQLGPKSITALNTVRPDRFIPMFVLARIKRYSEIVNRDRSQTKFLLGWINRCLA